MDGEGFLKNYISARVITAIIVSDKKEKYTVIFFNRKPVT